MDLPTLTIYMDKDPTPYIQDYKKQIQSLIHLTNLSPQPEKLIRQTVDFLLRYSNIDPTLPTTILTTIPKITSYKLKSNLISSVFVMARKDLITSYDVILTILENVPDCPKYINSVKPIIKSTDKDLIIKYYKTGNDKQKIFCYYFICAKFMDLDLICKGMFENSKIQKFCLKFIYENQVKLNQYWVGKLFKFINELDSRENIVMKMKVYCQCVQQLSGNGLCECKRSKESGCEDNRSIENKCKDEHSKDTMNTTKKYAKENTKHYKSIIPLALSMIDVNKEDIKDLMNIVVDSCTIDEALGVVKNIRNMFCSPYKDEEMICYGMNLMRQIYLKFVICRKCSEDSVDDGENDESGSDEIEEVSDVEECFEGGSSDEEVVGGDNDKLIKYTEENKIVDEDNIKINTATLNASNTITLNNKDIENTLILLKDDILNYVECFKGMKSKSINYSYRSVINAIKNKKQTNREIDFIRKKLTKEERLDKYKKVLTKEEKKEMYTRRSKRKFKLSKKNIRRKK